MAEPLEPIFGLPNRAIDQADLLILPLPYEGTVSYGRGTASGPRAILEASTQVELWDEEVDADLNALRYHTADYIQPFPAEPCEEYLARVTQASQTLGEKRQPGALIVAIGGEHGVTPAVVAGLYGSRQQDLTIVQIDAHADLRREYEGSIYSHACAMRRLVDGGARLIAIGIRSLSRVEAEFRRQHARITSFDARDLATEASRQHELMHTLRQVSGDVYLTIDVDGLETSLAPATGTPEPGGIGWWQLQQILRALLLENPNRTMVGADVVETVPQDGTKVNEFTAARLIAKLAAYAQLNQSRSTDSSPGVETRNS